MYGGVSLKLTGSSFTGQVPISDCVELDRPIEMGKLRILLAAIFRCLAHARRVRPSR